MILKLFSEIFRIRPKNLFILGLLFFLFDFSKFFWVGFCLTFGSFSWWVIVGSWQLTHHDGHAPGTSLRRIKDDIRASIHRESNNRF